MPTPRQMFTNALNALKGFIEEYALDFKGRLHNDVVVRVPAGSVVHLAGWESLRGVNANAMDVVGLFKTGTPKQGGNPVMGIFVWQSSDDFDVTNDGGDPSSNDGALWIGIVPARRGVLNGLVASGPYELQTTEYDTTKTYTANALLYGEPNDTNTNLPWAGRLTTDNGGGTNPRTVCGVVSRGVVTNYNDVSVLSFWSVFIG